MRFQPKLTTENRMVSPLDHKWLCRLNDAGPKLVAPLGVVHSSRWACNPGHLLLLSGRKPDDVTLAPPASPSLLK